ncbi:hypothetical protein Bra3105_18340 (plasmid) [Brachybacterium halotolerans subsp. kimchii]|uniref:hypothetical protein n=1 Tax=Brachybacterium halotolerans TaxID=2795215 RepID=UPI001E6078E3|nr:hypothetical protein [Brachybacterium halotolerans]UEJ84625.1 hypothetical protein Bra3105_18340 [Brachybacterium halotolerans subsp. kimchii]
MTPDEEAFMAGEAIEQVIGGVLIGYRLTIAGGTAVEATPWRRDPTLPKYAVRVTTANGAEAVYTVEQWAGSDKALRDRVRAWLLEHIDLRGTRRARSRRPDPFWRQAWTQFNPG